MHFKKTAITNVKLVYLVVLAACLTYLSLVFLSFTFLKNDLPLGAIFLLPLIPAILIYYNFKSRFSSTINIEVKDSTIKWTGNNQINFENLKSYKIQHFGGVKITLKQIRGKKIVFHSIQQHSDSQGLKNFAKRLHHKIKKHNENALHPIPRIKSLFERSWVKSTLISMTALIVVIVPHGFYTGEVAKTVKFLGFSLLFLSCWGPYIDAKKRWSNEP